MEKDYSNVVPKERIQFLKEVQKFVALDLERSFEPENYKNLGFLNGVSIGSLNSSPRKVNINKKALGIWLLSNFLMRMIVAPYLGWVLTFILSRYLDHLFFKISVTRIHEFVRGSTVINHDVQNVFGKMLEYL